MWAVVQVDGSERVMKLSVDSTPMGSVGISALPVSETTLCTSGKLFSAVSIRFTTLRLASRLIPGNFSDVTTIEPSDSFGRNSPPNRVASRQLPPNRANVRRTVTPVRCSAALRIGR